MTKQFTMDDGLAFYTSQLSHLEPKIYETKYRNIVYQDMVPVNANYPAHIDSIEYFAYDAVMVSKFIGANADDLPNLALNASKTLVPVFEGGNSYQYSLSELEKSQAFGLPLDATQATMSRRSFEEHAQRVAFVGDAARGVTGLFNNANVAVSESTVDYSTGTGAEIVADVFDFMNDLYVNSAEVHLPDTLVLPTSIWNQLNGQRMDSGTDTTVLEFIAKNNPYTARTGAPLDIRSNLELETLGESGSSVWRMMAYEKREENLFMPLVRPWTPLPPQPHNLTIKVPAHYKFGGVEFRYPGSAAYRDQYVA